MSKLLHYTGCGLEYVYLSGGYKEEEMGGDIYISVHNSESLYNSIAEAIVSSPYVLRGQEVRFLRGRLRLSQEGFAEALRGCSRSTVARWEAQRNEAIDETADAAIRWLYVRKMANDQEVIATFQRLREIEEAEYGQKSSFPDSVFESTEQGWELKAA
ncbi:hypothetical protein VH569_34090 [Azospirillum sp. 11R-A]|uniref:helix-turn-helix domain-containing protein n=1 Tax=Azospirillum sp. 11R-A TaxID=3111634 RepID=UPI003C1915E0